MKIWLLPAIVAGLSAMGCDEHLDQQEEAAGDRAEEIAEERVEAKGGDIIDQEFAGEVAEKRSEIAEETGLDEKALRDEPVNTAGDGRNSAGQRIGTPAE